MVAFSICFKLDATTRFAGCMFNNLSGQCRQLLQLLYFFDLPALAY